MGGLFLEIYEAQLSPTTSHVTSLNLVHVLRLIMRYGQRHYDTRQHIQKRGSQNNKRVTC